MRIALLFAGAAAISLVASTAAADVTEPNGLSVPIDSTLKTLFVERGESINWHTDAHVTPNAFSPLCGFTATFVLNQAANKLGLAWYNETGTKPLASDLHVLVAAGSPVGTSFSGTAIINDPAYAGGLVGFALLGGEVHYTNASYDNVCTTCSPSGPWITALMYASTKTPNAYYICFEDGATSFFGWDNDGDFNDDVFFITGSPALEGASPATPASRGPARQASPSARRTARPASSSSSPRRRRATGSTTTATAWPTTAKTSAPWGRSAITANACPGATARSSARPIGCARATATASIPRVRTWSARPARSAPPACARRPATASSVPGPRCAASARASIRAQA
ncbi:hypothetical protein A7982_13978 [Minicystis rosea]|nr:hypothetical protein A7982_13978 [Minicystis rosea]